jgi:transposase
LGALDFVTKKGTPAANDAYITAAEVCEMLRKLACEYTGKSVHIVLDNGRYQKCEVVTTVAKELGIALYYIPPYRPNLNLIERLWKHGKSRLRSTYYDRFDNFKDTLDSIIENTGNGSKRLIDKLMGKSVQAFDTLVPINENAFVSVNDHEKKNTLVA